jgi:hypothetical protein
VPCGLFYLKVHGNGIKKEKEKEIQSAAKIELRNVVEGKLKMKEK